MASDALDTLGCSITKKPLKIRGLWVVLDLVGTQFGGGGVNYGDGLILEKPAQLSTAIDWSRRFGCSTEVRANQDIVQQIGWYQCGGGGPVLYQQIAGLGHYWAGGKITRYPNRSTEQVGPYLSRFITTKVIWDYFEHLIPVSEPPPPQLIIIRP
jgi:poly(3-hydroxybutyrate) depolymerase